MATITLNFDARNVASKKLIDAILSTGLFKAEKTIKGLDEALSEVKEGKTVKCSDFNDYKKKVK